MYSVTLTPSFGLDLAHAVMDENLRRAAAANRNRPTPKRAGRRIQLPRPTAWLRRPAVAV